MKFNSTLAMALLTGAALFQAACNKSSNTTKPAATPGTDLIASQVAMNMNKSISGTYGGSNLGDGLTTGNTITNSTSNKSLNSTGSAYVCGFVADSNVNYTYTIGDTTGSVVGGIQFFFDCVNGQPVGYTLLDELFTKGKEPGYSFNYDVAQGYQVKSLNKYVTLLSVDGKLKSYQDFASTDPKHKDISMHNDFVLTGMVVDISVKGKSNITAGTATFHTKGFNETGSWDYVGTLEFLGNNIGKITFYGKVYLINLTTGKVV